MNEFLSQLKKMLPPRKSERGFSGKDFYFLIETEDGGTWLSSVDKKGKKVEPDYRYYEGSVAAMLRSLDLVRMESEFSVSWGQKDDRVNLSDSPHLIQQLVRCDNLRAADGTDIRVSDSQATLSLSLHKDGSIMTPTLQAVTEHGTDTSPHFLSDCFILSQGVIHPVQTLGDNYSRLTAFLSPFSEDMLEKYLSLLATYITGVKISCDGYVIEESDATVTAATALVFAKVDSDKSFHLQLMHSVPGMPADFMQDFELTHIASVGDDNRITIKGLVTRPLSEDADFLRRQIMKCAPNKEAQKEVYQDDCFFIVPQETAGPFLLQSLPTLLQRFVIIGADKLTEYKIKPVTPKLRLSLSSGIDFLEGNADVTVGDERFTLSQLLEQYRKNKYVVLSDGNRAIIDDGYMRRLERIFRGVKKGQDKVKISFFDLPEVEEMLAERPRGEVFKRHRKVFEGFNSLQGKKLSKLDIKAELRPYQVEGVKWIKYLYDNSLGGCLADDMGLGKTLQAISILAMIYPKQQTPSLVVMPRSLLFNWQNELARFAPQLSVYTYYGTTRSMDDALKHQVVLTTYAIVRNDVETFCKTDFHYVVLDESQNIKNVSAQTTQAVLLLRTKHRLALSGTPVENNLTELYSLFRFLNPAMFGSLDDFNSRYTYPIQRDGDKDTLHSLRRKIYPFMLRRLKKDVLSDLPDRIDSTLFAEMSKAHADFYEQRRQYYFRQVKMSIATEGVRKSQFMMLQALGELRRIASVPESLTNGEITSPKLDLLLEALCEAVTNGHKTVVFFNYIAGVELVGERLDQEGIDYASMTGSTRDRRNIVERFQNDASCKVLLMTLKTGGVGLNLTAADTVFIFEPWWNKAAEEQAVNRLHRIGQTAKVLSYSIITQGTIEEKIQLLQQQKAELLEGLIGSDSASSKSLTEEDIDYILG